MLSIICVALFCIIGFLLLLLCVDFMLNIDESMFMIKLIKKFDKIIEVDNSPEIDRKFSLDKYIFIYLNCLDQISIKKASKLTNDHMYESEVFLYGPLTLLIKHILIYKLNNKFGE